MKRAFLLGGLVLVALALALAIFLLRRHAVRGPGAGRISAERALHDLFGEPVPHNQVALGGDRVASVWAEQSFTLGNVERVAVLVAIEKSDGDCHGCPARLGAVVYRREAKVETGWQLESAAREIGEIGSFGEAGSPKGLEARPIGTGRTVLLVPSLYTNQGFTEQGVLLLVYAPPRWIDAGFVMTAEDNAGECTDDPKARDDEHPDPCWSYTSRLIFTRGADPEFDDIRVEKAGTYQAAPAKSVTYAFDGKEYRPR